MVRSAVAFARVFLDDADHGVAFDELALATNGLAEDRSGEAVEVAHGPGGGRVQERTASEAKSSRSQPAVVGRQWRDLEAMMELRV